MNLTPNVDLKSQLVAEFEATEDRLNGASKTAFFQRKKEALRTFEKLGFPTIRHEEWKYSNVKGLVNQAFDFHAPGQVNATDVDALQIPNLVGNILYFVNGIYQPELSAIISPESQLRILHFGQAAREFPEVVEQHFGKYADYSDNAFTALNTAFAQHGIFIHVPDGVTVEMPVILRFISDTRTQNVASQPRNLVVVGRRADVKVAESFRTLGDNAAFTNIVTEVILGEEAHFEYYKVQNESDKAYHIGTTHIHHARASQSYSVTVSINGGFIRNNLDLVLDGERCDAHMYGLYLPNERQHIDNHTLVVHAQPNCESSELYKGILYDGSTGVFNGKIFVKQNAQKTNAYQSCRNVLASPEASMNTKPQLEIYADDVKCSHGTTTGQLNEEAMFYLQSRGIPKDKARALLMQAFAQDVIEKMRIPAIKQYLEGLIVEKIGEV